MIPADFAVGDLRFAVVEVLLELAGVQRRTLAVYAAYKAVREG